MFKKSMHSRLWWKAVRALSLCLLLLLTSGTVSLLQAADPVEIDDISDNFICTCSCGQLLSACNMVGCSNSGPMQAEVAAYLDEGRDEKSIVDLFVEKYGLTVLSAPPTAGWFNMSAWAMPFVALLLGMGMVVHYARRFRGRWTAPAAGAEAGNSAFQQRLADELAEYTPED